MSGGRTAREEQHERVRAEFARQAESWGRDSLSPDLLWAVDVLAPRPDLVALDVAAGTGLLARALAPRVRSVVAVDLTPEMLAHGRRNAKREGLANVRFEEGAAERLPHPAGVFDLAATRFSVHHFDSPDAVILEMARVTRDRGRVGIIDLVSSEDETVAARHNRLERLRDPSHARALSASELASLVRASGLKELEVHSREVTNRLEDWLDRARTPQSAREEIRSSLRDEFAGGPATGFRPFTNADGTLSFRHTWRVVIGTR